VWRFVYEIVSMVYPFDEFRVGGLYLKMRVFNIMLCRGLGGTEQAYRDYSEALGQAGVDVINVSSSRAAINTVQTDSLKLINLVPWCLISKLQLHFLIRRYKPDLLIAHGGRAIKFAAASKPKRVKLVGVTHLYKERYLKKSDYLIAITEHLKQYMQGHGYEGDKIFVVPNMIHLQTPYLPFPISGKNSFVIGSYGRFCKQKGFETLIQSLSLLRKRGYAAKLVLGGGGDLEHTLKQQVAALGFEDVVTFVGWVTDKEAFFKAIDFFCLPSFGEAFGIALLEAMAHSKPIVASNVSGPSEILSHETDALLAEPASPQDLADKLAEYMDHPEKAAVFADKAYEKVRDTYEIAKVSQRLLGALTCINAHASAR
jgi:glycosyltransferase involved in cell wall biosynthesis